MGALLVLWLRPVPAEMAPFFTGPNIVDAFRAFFLLSRCRNVADERKERKTKALDELASQSKFEKESLIRYRKRSSRQDRADFEVQGKYRLALT